MLIVRFGHEFFMQLDVCAHEGMLLNQCTLSTGLPKPRLNANSSNFMAGRFNLSLPMHIDKQSFFSADRNCFAYLPTSLQSYFLIF